MQETQLTGKKEIIQQVIPLNENGYPSIAQKFALHIHDYLMEKLGEDYIVITSPLEIKSINGNTKIIRIDSKEYSYDELEEIIEKAYMYDDLCE